jgi:hypothetical protein
MFASVVYWMVGYATSLDHFVKFLIVVLEVNFVSAALLICVSCLTNSLAGLLSFLLGPFVFLYESSELKLKLLFGLTIVILAATFSSSLLLLLMLLFGGFLLNFGTIPVYFVWIRSASPFILLRPSQR